jgi:hypothetical protein
MTVTVTVTVTVTEFRRIRVGLAEGSGLFSISFAGIKPNGYS